MPEETATLEPGTELPSPQAAAEVAAEESPAAEPNASAPEESPPPAETPRYLIDGEPVDDDYAVLDHPKMKPHMERHDRRTEERLRGEYEANLQQSVKQLESNHLLKSYRSDHGRLVQEIRNSDLDGADLVIERLEKLLGPAAETREQELRSEGHKLGSANMSNAFFGVLTEKLDRRNRDEFDDRVKTDPSLTWGDVLEDWYKRRSEPAIQKLKDELQSRDDIIERLKTEGRTDKGPNLAQSSGGGAAINSYEEASRRYNLPVGHPEKISHEAFKEQRARFGIK